MLLSYPYIKFSIEKIIFFVIFLRDENTDGLTVSVDGAWQKRGSGRSFDSLSGAYN